ncbi:MAG: enoyl-CoA hydratase/isomerase family protein [Acidimicrobiia bacterium]
MSGEEEHVVVEVADRVMVITLNRPQKLNAITPAMNASMDAAFADARSRDDVGVVLIKGNGRAFSAGADLGNAAAGGGTRHNAPADMVANRKRVQGLLDLWSFPKPVVAAVHGYCLGVASELMACCDMVVVGENAKIGSPETRTIALIPTLAFWPSSLGIALTKDMLFTGRLLDGREAVAYGLAARVVPDADVHTAALEIAKNIAEVPTARLAVVKQSVNSWVEGTLIPAALKGAEYHALFHQASEKIVDPSAGNS